MELVSWLFLLVLCISGFLDYLYRRPRRSKSVYFYTPEQDNRYHAAVEKFFRLHNKPALAATKVPENRKDTKHPEYYIKEEDNLRKIEVQEDKN